DVVEPPHALHIRVRVRQVNDPALAYHVIDDDQAAAARKTQRPREVVRVARLIRVDEDQVERPAALRGELGQRVERPPEAPLDDARQPGPGDVGPGDVGVLRLGLERDQAAPGRQGPGEPDRAVAPERADFQNVPRPLEAGQEVQQLALVWRHVDRWQAGRGAVAERRVQRGIGGYERAGDVAIDRGPLLLRHESSPPPLVEHASRVLCKAEHARRVLYGYTPRG